MKDAKRKAWHAPTVTEYGSVEELTGFWWWDVEDGECTTRELGPWTIEVCKADQSIS